MVLVRHLVPRDYMLNIQHSQFTSYIHRYSTKTLTVRMRMAIVKNLQFVAAEWENELKRLCYDMQK